MHTKKRRTKTRKPVFSGVVPEVMDIIALARYLGLGRSKIYGLIRLKKIPASRIGRQYRFSKPLIDAWLKDHLIMRVDETQFPLFDKAAR
jgi:excisionase family DNA binding protein